MAPNCPILRNPQLVFKGSDVLAEVTGNSIKRQALEVWEKLVNPMEVSNPFVRANPALNRPMQRLRYIPLIPGASACLGAVQMSRSYHARDPPLSHNAYARDS